VWRSRAIPLPQCVFFAACTLNFFHIALVFLLLFFLQLLIASQEDAPRDCSNGGEKAGACASESHSPQTAGQPHSALFYIFE